MTEQKRGKRKSGAPQELVLIPFDHRILEAASQFCQAAEDASRTDLPHRLDVWLAYPEVVNYAFAAELALKGLHWLHHGHPSRGHDLHTLCVALPPQVVRELGNHTADTPLFLFLERLAAVRDTFEDWRYAFEKEELSISIDFMRALAGGAIALLQRDAPPATDEG
ncbi:HEPN domain-containing protein [Variovorax sp. N23]|uniref:HEPN domain-containing protein n=1 Tax=Variovorax sp. N23 TaxID=2980555 RepID=UPI0021CA3896|nr:HEPN domain-containing protein [Variovorax sp. N23]MCU4118873.1 HEPN domain-containing protein [Variovorax sp. N23]